MSIREVVGSGIDWIGDIPKHWRMSRIKEETKSLESGRRPPDEPEDVLSIGGEHIQDGCFYLANPRYVSISTYSSSRGKIRIGDTLVVKDGATIGKCMYVDSLPSEKMLLNEHVYRLKTDKFNYYWIASDGAQNWFRSNNMSTAQESISQDVIYSLPVPVPTVAEKEAIAAYLDEKTAIIEARVAVLEQKLVAYKRLKLSVINRAVTRGLDMQSKLKDSGIDWIGRIPGAWNQLRLGDLVGRGVTYGIVKLDDRDELGVKVLRCSDVLFGHIDTSDVVSVSQKLSEEYSRTILRGGEVLVNVRGTLGGCAVVDEKLAGWNIAREVAMLDIRENVADKRFVMYLLLSPVFKRYVAENLSGAVYVGINIDSLVKFNMPIPPLSEQHAIADHLDAECAKIDKMAELVTREIELYRKLKRSLINEVVTGKRTVV